VLIVLFAQSWLYAANDWYINKTYPYGPLPTHRWLRPRFNRVIHIVRSPMKTISSVTGHSKLTYHFLFRNMPLLIGEDPDHKRLFEKAKALVATCERGGACRLMAAATTWVFWNRHIARYSDVRYKIDQLQAVVEDVCLHSSPWLAKHGNGANATAHGGNCTSSLRSHPKEAVQCPQMKSSHNPKRAHDDYTWQQLKAVDAEVAEMVREDALLYGFGDLSVASAPKKAATTTDVAVVLAAAAAVAAPQPNSNNNNASAATVRRRRE
jgi:hypothetical protein